MVAGNWDSTGYEGEHSRVEDGQPLHVADLPTEARVLENEQLKHTIILESAWHALSAGKAPQTYSMGRSTSNNGGMGGRERLTLHI